jgi:hypothetical protein
MSEFRETINALATPAWARRLTDDDEWVVRTALANVRADLENALAAMPPEERGGARQAITESIARYRATLARIEEADVA